MLVAYSLGQNRSPKFPNRFKNPKNQYRVALGQTVTNWGPGGVRGGVDFPLFAKKCSAGLRYAKGGGKVGSGFPKTTVSARAGKSTRPFPAILKNFGRAPCRRTQKIEKKKNFFSEKKVPKKIQASVTRICNACVWTSSWRFAAQLTRDQLFHDVSSCARHAGPKNACFSHVHFRPPGPCFAANARPAAAIDERFWGQYGGDLSNARAFRGRRKRRKSDFWLSNFFSTQFFGHFGAFPKKPFLQTQKVM